MEMFDGVRVRQPGDGPGVCLAEVSESGQPPGGRRVSQAGTVDAVGAGVPQVQVNLSIACVAAREPTGRTERLVDADRSRGDRREHDPAAHLRRFRADQRADNGAPPGPTDVEHALMCVEHIRREGPRAADEHDRPVPRYRCEIRGK
jgi:hypothetical protein